MDIIRSPLVNLLEKSFIDEIKMTAYSDHRILMVTKTDEVYGLGPLPGSEYFADGLELRPIPQLHKKNVERFVFGENFIFILTEKGEVFGWGENGSCQLGTGNKDYVYEPTLITTFEGIKIIDIACGSLHSIALCNEKKVYFWGERGSSLYTVPQCVDSNVIGIASSENAAFCLYSNFKVYGRKYLVKRQSDSYYTIGNGYTKSFTELFEQIETLSNIMKIVGGKSHAMALSNDGVLFIWGGNQKNQLSGKITSDQGVLSVPVKLSSISEKIIDIAASSLSDLSAVMTESSKIYVWGGHAGGHFFKPFLTRFTSFDEVFAYYSNPSMAYKGITFPKIKRSRCFDFETGTLESIFDVQEDSDLTIVVQEKDIHVHKAILKARCKYFLAMFTNQWKENNEKILRIDGYSYDSYKNFLLYLYTGDLDLTTESVFELVAIADKYSEDALLKLIERKLDNSSIPDEIIGIIKDIMKLSSPNMEKFCDGMKRMIDARMQDTPPCKKPKFSHTN